jgi:hypothetical protein
VVRTSITWILRFSKTSTFTKAPRSSSGSKHSNATNTPQFGQPGNVTGYNQYKPDNPGGFAAVISTRNDQRGAGCIETQLLKTLEATQEKEGRIYGPLFLHRSLRGGY